MKKNVFNFMFVIGLCVMLLSIAQPVSAKDLETSGITTKTQTVYGDVSLPNYNGDINVSPTILSTGMFTRGTSAPSSVWNWNNGRCTINGDSEETVLYTNYIYSNATTINLGLTRAKENFTIQLVQKDAGLFWTDKVVSDLRVDGIPEKEEGYVTRIYTFSGLNPSAKYYIKILPRAHFTGYVAKIA